MAATLDSLAHHAASAAERLPARLALSLRSRGAPSAAQAVERVQVDSPLVLSFACACTLVHACDAVVPGLSLSMFAVPSRFEPFEPLAWFRLLSHMLGHVSWEHLQGNLVSLLLVGPACESAFGTAALLRVMLWAALASAVAHILLGERDTVACGASGEVFALILLNSLLERRRGRVPLTFLLQVVLWCGGELVALARPSDGTSHLAHLAGAAVGTVCGQHMGRSAPGSSTLWKRLFGKFR